VILLTWPFHGLVAIFQEVIHQAEDALYDETALQGELKSLNARFEAGEMTEDEFTQREDELAERLMAAEEYNRRKREAVS